MYQVLCDEFLLYDDSVEEYKLFSPKIELAINEVGKFDFTIYTNHPNYDSLKRLKSIIRVYQDDFLLFRGRILNDEAGFYNQKQVTCEGELAFLLDSIQRPYEFTGTPSELFTQFIESHNAQVDEEHRFKVGKITVTDPNDYINRSEVDYLSTWQSIQQKLLETLGGYIWIRHEEDGVYIDYLLELNLLSPQEVEFGKNLLDMKRMSKGEDVATAIIPLGAKAENSESRLTIASVNNGVDYVYNQEAVEQYGWIFKTMTWDDVTDVRNLLNKGNEAVQEQMQMLYSIELDAADLATVSKAVESFHLGTQVQVTSDPHGINQRFIVSKLSIDLLNPASNKLTLGAKVESFTEKSAHNFESIPMTKGEKGEKGEDAVVLRIDSSRGTVFKNNQITTTLTVAIYYGEKRIINKSELSEAFGAGAYLEWSWQRMDESAFGVISASDSRIRDDGFTFVLTPSDIDTKATFMCNLNV